MTNISQPLVLLPLIRQQSQKLEINLVKALGLVDEGGMGRVGYDDQPGAGDATMEDVVMWG